MIIHNVNIFLEKQQFYQGAIVIREGTIREIRYGAMSDNAWSDAESGEQVINGEGCYLIPGLIDTHFHGALGYDVCDGTMEAFRRIADYELSVGVTAICPATLTLPTDDLCKVLETGAAFADAQRRRTEGGARLIGFNMEGPFISRDKKGAQNEQYIQPINIDLVRAFMQASGGLVRFIGLAPEENPDYQEFIREVRDYYDEYGYTMCNAFDPVCTGAAPYLQVALAHTNADYDTAYAALQAGASHIDHLYNAMSGLNHREPGVVGAAMDYADINRYNTQHPANEWKTWSNRGLGTDRTRPAPARTFSAEIICDGIHVHPAAVRAAFHMIGPEHMVMISDSLRATGVEDGEYMLGGQEIVKKGNICRLKEDGNIAGSVTNLTDCMRTAVRRMAMPLEMAVACCTVHAAQSIHEDGTYGTIASGRLADLVLLAPDEALTLRGVIHHGQMIG